MSRQTFVMLVMTFTFVLVLAACLDVATAVTTHEMFVPDVQLDPSCCTLLVR